MEKQPKIESNIEAEIAKIMALPWWSYGAGIKSEDIRKILKSLTSRTAVGGHFIFPSGNTEFVPMAENTHHSYQDEAIYIADSEKEPRTLEEAARILFREVQEKINQINRDPNKLPKKLPDSY